ncbi:MAG: hypothetical protein ACI8PZ_005333 [Myxococcota bacterium]|jgi:hypothetical protein
MPRPTLALWILLTACGGGSIKTADTAADAGPPRTTPAGSTPGGGTTASGSTATGTTPTGTGTTPTGTGTTPTGTGTTPTGTTTPICDTPPPRVLINEVVASNRDSFFTSDGQTPDWIELYNADPTPVDLDGWGLSDDAGDRYALTFDSRVLPPGGRLLVLASGEYDPGTVGSWDTRVDEGHLWSYLPVTEPPPADWAEPGFDASAWGVGPSGFGRSDGDDATVVDGHTVYVRTELDLSADELADLTTLWLHVDFDDGFVAWLNGVELARQNVDGWPPAWDAFASPGHEALLYQGLPPEGFDVTDAIDLLVEGPNVLAVEVHDATPDSSDLSLIPFFTLGYGSLRDGAMAAPVLGLPSTLPSAPFSLAASGEEVWLTAPDGCTADQVVVPELWRDEAYGRSPDGGPWGVFLESTPGAPNDTEARPGFAATPILDPAPGFHRAGSPITVSSADPAAVLYSTSDGSPPDASSPPWGGASVGDATTVVRVRAEVDGLWPSRIATGTYLPRARPDVGVVSLVMDPDDLWDPVSGMYVLGESFEDWLPYFGANFWEDWERDVHVELFEPDSDRSVGLDAGVVIHGGWSRANEQRSLRLTMRAGYGAQSLEYPVFPGHGIESFNRLILRNSGNDWHGCGRSGCSGGAYLRDVVVHRLVWGLNIDALADRPVLTYLNGEPWGMYNLRERSDKHWIAETHGHSDIDLLEWADTALEGDNEHWLDTMEVLRLTDRTDPSSFDWLAARVDLEEYANYQATQVFVDNTDWPGNNLKWWRPRTPDGRYRWLLYDTDFGLGLWGAWPGDDTLAFALDPDGPGWPNPAWSTEFFRLAIELPQFKTMFVNQYADLLNTRFHPDVSRAVLAEAEAERIAAMGEHLDRWGTYGDAALWDGAWAAEVAWIDSWLADRPAYAREHLIANLDLVGTWPLELHSDPPGAGRFELAAVTVDAPFDGLYFATVPVTITAVPEPGWTFVRWDDPGLPVDETVVVGGGGDGRVLTAVFE